MFATERLLDVGTCAATATGMPKNSTLLFLVAAAASGCALAEDTLETANTSSEENVWQWTDDGPITAQTSPYQPGLAPFASRLHMAYRGNDNANIYITRFDGTSWSSATQVPNQLAEYGPALTVFDNRLTMMYHASGQNRLVMTTSTNGTTWSSPVTAGTSIGTSTIRYAPAITVHQGSLYAAYCKQLSSGAEKVHLDRFDGASWSSIVDFAVPVNVDSFNCKHIAIATLPNGRLDIVYTVAYPNPFCSGSDCWRMYEVSGFGTPSSSWIPKLMTMKSKKPPSIVSCGTTTHLVHGGYSTPDEMWWSFWNGSSWSANVKVPDRMSGGGAALGCYQGTRAVMVHNGVAPQLSWSEYGL